MEEPIGDGVAGSKNGQLKVLILVLVEEPIGEHHDTRIKPHRGVLILVLVEEPIGGMGIDKDELVTCGLNPCFSGRTYRSLLSTQMTSTNSS